MRWFLTFFFGPRCCECLRRARWATFPDKKRSTKPVWWCHDHYLGTQTVPTVQILDRQM